MARRSRAAERAARRRAMRQRVLLVAAAVLGVVLMVVGGWLVIRGGGDGTDPVAAPPARQLTTLVQVTGADGTAAASALLGTTAKGKQAAAVLIPSRLIVDVAGSGEMPFGEAAALDDETASTGAVTDLLGVSVDDSWTMTTDGLAALVDSVGGVQAAVDVDVVTTDAKGNETVVVRAGNQHLKARPPPRTPPTSPTASPSRRGWHASTTSSPGSRRRCRRTMPLSWRRWPRSGTGPARRWTPRRWPTGWQCSAPRRLTGRWCPTCFPSPRSTRAAR
jgi:hypothetical protein